jgi:PDDEXK-like domain of unknown function (DUF3799)
MLFDEKCPLWFQCKKASDAKDSTKAMDFGSAFHTMMLEPELFDTRHVQSPFDSFRTNEAKAWRDGVLAKGQTIVTKEEKDTLTGMLMSVRQHPRFKQIMLNSPHELTAVAKHSGTGLLRRARIDVLPRGNFVLDFKSARDGSKVGFGKAVWDEGYYRQAAHYLDVFNEATGEKRTEFLFWAVEKEPPYLNAIYPCPLNLIEVGRKLNNATLYKIKHCMDSGSWPGHPADFEEFELPGWALRQVEQMEKYL